MIQRHKAECLIHLLIDQLNIQIIKITDAFPVLNPGTTQRIHADFEFRVTDSIHVDHVTERTDVRLNQVHRSNQRAAQGITHRHLFHLRHITGQQHIGTLFDNRGKVSVCRAAGRRVIFDATIFRRVVRRGDHNAVGFISMVAVVSQDGMRHRRCRGETIIFLNNNADTICCQYG